MKGAFTSWQVYIQCRGNSETRERLFLTVWNLYRKRLLYFIRNFVGDDAEDVFQEIMLKVFLNIAKFNPLYGFNTWIYTIARNHCLNHLGKKQLPMAGKDPESSLSESGYTTQEDSVIQKELHREIDRVLGTLSEDHRQIAYLRFFEGMRYRDIARIMNLPAGTIKSRLHASRLRLKRALEVYDER